MPGLAHLRTLVKNFKAADTKVMVLKATLELHPNQAYPPSEENCIDNLATGLPPETLYNKELIAGTNTLFRVIKKYLEIWGQPFKKHPDNHRLPYFVTITLYKDENDVNYAYDQLEMIWNKISNNSNIEQVTSHQSDTQHFVVQDPRN